MATLGHVKSSILFRGISSFWTRFFKDTETLENLYNANDQLIGQVYLELMECLLANSIKDIPVFAKEYWKLITFSSSEVTIDGVYYRFSLKDKVRELPFLYNKIFEPSVILENNKDYYIDGNYIYFYNNIFDDSIYNGVAKKRSGTSTVISFWAPEARVDKGYIYEHYGRMLSIYEESSEAYKEFIRGIWFYYMNGPTVTRIKSALNIIGGYPVVSNDNEVVTAISHTGGYHYITTTYGDYSFPDTVGVGVSVGDTLMAFDSLTDAYTVSDYIYDPNWFDHIVVPIEVLPTLSVTERTTNRYDPDPIFIGYPILIGTEGWYIGMGGLPNFMWLFFNKVLKYNIFYITYDALASRFTRSTEDLQEIVLAGKPAYTLALVVPYFNLKDTVTTPTELFSCEIIS